MLREQKYRMRPGAKVWCWLPLILTLVVYFATPACRCAARAAEAEAETAAETAVVSEDEAKDEATEVEASADQKDEKEASNEKEEAGDSEEIKDEAATDEKEMEGKDDKQAESTAEKPATEEKSGDKKTDDKTEEAPKETKAMKSSASPPAQQAAPEGGATPAVEADPAIEVEPPKDDAENGSKKPIPPKKQPEHAKKKKCVIGATATLLEMQSELLFSARVDSGAKSCSMHIEKMEIEGEAEKMVDNIGKVIRFQVKNGDKKTHWLKSKIAGYVIIKTSDNKERRYKVPLTFRWKHMEKEVLVTLNNRNHMEYPLLLGRNFLRGDFLIDVALDSDD